MRVLVQNAFAFAKDSLLTVQGGISTVLCIAERKGQTVIVSGVAEVDPYPVLALTGNALPTCGGVQLCDGIACDADRETIACVFRRIPPTEGWNGVVLVEGRSRDAIRIPWPYGNSHPSGAVCSGDAVWIQRRDDRTDSVQSIVKYGLGSRAFSEIGIEGMPGYRQDFAWLEIASFYGRPVAINDECTKMWCLDTGEYRDIALPCEARRVATGPSADGGIIVVVGLGGSVDACVIREDMEVQKVGSLPALPEWASAKHVDPELLPEIGPTVALYGDCVLLSTVDFTLFYAAIGASAWSALDTVRPGEWVRKRLGAWSGELGSFGKRCGCDVKGDNVWRV